MPIEKDKVVTLHYTLIDADNDLTLAMQAALPTGMAVVVSKP